MAFKRSAVRSRLSPPKSPEICQIKGRFPNVPFFYVASTQLPMPEFGLNSLKSCCSPNFRCNSSADIIHEHGAKCQEDGLRFVIFPINDQCGSGDHFRPTWPTKRNRATSAWKPPNINVIPHLFSPVHSQFLQLFASILMEHPILHFSRFGVIMKVQKGVSPMY